MQKINYIDQALYGKFGITLDSIIQYSLGLYMKDKLYYEIRNEIRKGQLPDRNIEMPLFRKTKRS